MDKTYNKNVNKKPGEPADVITPEDQSLWNYVTSDVKPLRSHSNKINLTKIKENQVIKTSGISQTLAPRETLEKRTNFFKHGRAPGLDKRTRTRMRRGQIAIEAQLDLHGMTQSEAHQKLTQFIQNSYANGRRSILVITGKGRGSDSSRGVLRNAVPQWLNQPSLTEFIKAFDYASRPDGGEGALYVLLRRRK